MYTLVERMKAVELYIQYDRKAATVRRELGYPSHGTLKEWINEYETTGTLRVGYEAREPKYTNDQKQIAIDYWLNHGRSFRGAVRALGYPNRETLRQWVHEAVKDSHILRSGKIRKTKVDFTDEQKQAAVTDLCLREGRAQDIADKHGVTRPVLYKWRNELLGKEPSVGKPKENESHAAPDQAGLESEVESLKHQVDELRKEVHQLQLEKDILEATAAIIKKDPGVDPTKLSNREKALVIDALKNKNTLAELLLCLAMSKSSYFYQRQAMSVPDKYAELRVRIRTAFTEAQGRYGYRRIHAVLRRNGDIVSEKVVRKIMIEEGLTVIARKARRYNAYKGEISPAVANIIDRNFHADAPNTKWLTDITEFAIPAGKVYLSPVIDCFDGTVTSWSISTTPNAEMANSSLDQAISTLKDDEYPVVHSDRGGHYRWPGWIERMESRGLIRSMSKKGCTGDNAACEGFFGRIKNEMFYGRNWDNVTIEEFINILDRYLHWYNETRIKMSLGAMSPMEYRRSLNYA